MARVNGSSGERDGNSLYALFAGDLGGAGRCEVAAAHRVFLVERSLGTGHGVHSETVSRYSASSFIFFARSRSFCVMPPASCVVRSTTTRPYTLNHSGWWLRASATSAAALMNENARTKSGNLNSRWSLPPAIDQPGSAATARASSSPV